MMPLSATSFFKRFIVSGMEYALLMRTMPSFSAARAVTGEVNAKAKRAADRMRRASMEASFFLGQPFLDRY
jgi:hypothetical protein